MYHSELDLVDSVGLAEDVAHSDLVVTGRKVAEALLGVLKVAVAVVDQMEVAG